MGKRLKASSKVTDTTAVQHVQTRRQLHISFVACVSVVLLLLLLLLQFVAVRWAGFCNTDDCPRQRGTSNMLGAVVMVRHGARTPVHPLRLRRNSTSSEVFYPFDVGPGELTNVGRRHGELVGEVLREQYHKQFLRNTAGHKHNTEERFVEGDHLSVDFEVLASKLNRTREMGLHLLSTLMQGSCHASVGACAGGTSTTDIPAAKWFTDGPVPERRRLASGFSRSDEQQLNALLRLQRAVNNDYFFRGHARPDVEKEGEAALQTATQSVSELPHIARAISAFKAAGYFDGKTDGLGAIKFLKRVYAHRWIFEAHGMSLPKSLQDIDAEHWRTAESAAQFLWRFNLPTERAGHFAGGAVLAETVRRLSVLASYHANQNVCGDCEGWNDIGAKVAEYVNHHFLQGDHLSSSVAAPPPKLTVLSGHRESVITFQTAMHVTKRDLFVPSTGEWFAAELWKDQERIEKCKSQKHSTSGALCEKLGYVARIMVNGITPLSMPEKLVRRDCMLLDDSSTNCTKVDRTTAVSLLSFQDLIENDWRKFGSPLVG